MRYVGNDLTCVKTSSPPSPSLSPVADILEALDPVRYFSRLGISLYHWQKFILNAVARGETRIIINGARQAGKSTIVSGIPLQLHKANGKLLSLILASSERQAKLDIDKLMDYIHLDSDILVQGLGADHVVLGDGSVMKALPATEKTVRGHSGPGAILLDEASRLQDALYYGGMRPMLTGNPHAVLVLLSTPWGKRGVFYDTWNKTTGSWMKIEVRAPFDIVNGRLVDAMPEAEYQAKKLKENIYAFYSPRHTRAFMEEELDTVGERWVRQEYLCEFVDTVDSAFAYDDINAAFVDDGEPLFGEGMILDDDLCPLFREEVSA